MASKREKAPDRRMRKIALVICEGETEVRYINLLKTWYKSPIRIVSHIEGTKITPSLVEKRTKELKISQWDKVHTFLMYDMDVQAINEKLKKCKAEMLLSNLCFEIWLLLHSRDQKAAIDTATLIKELKKVLLCGRIILSQPLPIRKSLSCVATRMWQQQEQRLYTTF